MLTQELAWRACANCELADSLRARNFSFRRVILFGSYARQEQRRWSDIDVALVADEFTGLGFRDVSLMGDVSTDRKFVDLEPHTLSPEQFADWNPFGQEIKRAGTVVGEREPAAAGERA